VATKFDNDEQRIFDSNDGNDDLIALSSEFVVDELTRVIDWYCLVTCLFVFRVL
jgi:hypothetical protein